ncbi:kelch domain-containing protein [Alteromonas mediterranea 615]|uniref:Kelch domain-containing protein n=1 Tax=Alteromonas mediterranea 615 TaxID=1300253 RepID=S5AHE0_9ALTE|nr:kelch domain-containing protein [Alteromonas mediterranea 615]
MQKRPLFLPTLTLLSLSIASQFAIADRNKGKVPIVTPECSNIEVCKQKGVFTDPFEEPLVSGEFPDQNNTNITNPINNYPDNGKCEENEDGVLKCKPAAGSLALLNDGRVLYFNALEGTENVEYNALLEIGSAIINDQTRVLTMKNDNASWIAPSPVDAGANPDGNDSETIIGDITGLLGTSLPVDLNTDDDRTNNDGALFCADLVGLPNGELMAVGGTDYYHEPGVNTSLLGEPINFGLSELEGLKNSRIFNPEDNSWRKTGDMNFGRWYPSALSLANGNVLVASGVTKLVKPVYLTRPETSGRNVTVTETYDTSCGEWTDNGPLAERSLPLYPRLHLLPNGHVFYNGGGQAFNPFGQSYDQALWNIVAAYDPSSKTWADLGFAGLPLHLNEAGISDLASFLNVTNTQSDTSLNGLLTGLTEEFIANPFDALAPVIDDPYRLADVQSLLGAGFRGSTFSMMLPLTPDSEGKYSKAEFLTAGGVLTGVAATSPGLYVGTNLARIDSVTIDGEKMLYDSRSTGSLTQGRWYGTGVLLPTGEVLVVSGADRDEVVLPGSGKPILKAEIFDPETETFKQVAEQNRPRTYHNSAALLPDGSVLIGGHAPINTAYAYSVTLPGFSPNDGRDPSFEIYKPAYMFGDRPAIGKKNKTVSVGERFRIGLKNGDEASAAMNAKIESAVLIRRTNITHLIDGDQRSVILPIVRHNTNSIVLEMPSQQAVVPPGDYMLFVNARDEEGNLVPSASKAITVTGELSAMCQ